MVLAGFSDRNDGAGESRFLMRILALTAILPPMGRHGRFPSHFQISESLLFGQNLQEIRLSGVNALSFFIDGNLTVAKSFQALQSQHFPIYPRHPYGWL